MWNTNKYCAWTLLVFVLLFVLVETVAAQYWSNLLLDIQFTDPGCFLKSPLKL